jgi:histidine triad (HIT) family protein
MELAADCIFCKILRGELPSKQVFENEQVLAFYDIELSAPIHILIIPKKHIRTMNDVQTEDWPYIVAIHQAAQQIAIEFGIADSGYRLVNNCNSDGGQMIYHLHYHLLGGEKLGSPVAKSKEV